MVFGGSRAMEQQREAVDALNVFPVPDGDTGTNMFLTVQSAAREAAGLENPTVSQVASAASMGSLMGARGNSGVILSQLFRGISKGLEGKTTATASDLARALQIGVETAYQAVMKPVEGTILTVARESAKEAVQAARRKPEIQEMLETALVKGEETLARTPDMLTTLKQAGVVDAGGKGFLVILEGWLAALTGKEIQPPTLVEQPVQPVQIDVNGEEIVFQYCTEFILKGSDLQLEKIKQDLAGEGDCLLVVGTADVAKVHIHTNHPGQILEYGVRLGTLHEVEIHNMREQSEAKRHAAKGENLPENPADPKTPLKGMGLVTVAVGRGLVEIFRSLGVDEIIQGGQTMNPSTEELVEGINRTRAEKVFVLPNNGNIILAAGQAAALTDKKVHVVPTRSIPQGISAVLAFEPATSFEENAQTLDGSFGSIMSGEVTYAVRASQFDGNEIKAGDILGLIDDKIVLTGEDPARVAVELAEKMGGEEADLISVFYGQDVPEEVAGELAAELRKRFSRSEVEVHDGGQPLYYYIVSVE